MEVQGISPELLDEVRDSSVISGQVNASGTLVLTTRGGEEKNAGSVVKPLLVWPVGSVYIGTSSTNPTEFFGGTWEQFGHGRVLVGQDDSQSEFSTALGVGGAKTHTLTAAEMPSHNHGGATGDQSRSHTHTGYTTSGGEHEHIQSRVSESRVVTGGGAATVANWNFGNYSTGGGGAHSHNVQTTDANQGHTHPIGSSGGGAAHNNLQPFIVVYMWKRTA